MPVEDQVLVVYAASEGFVDSIPVSEVQRYEVEARVYFRANHSDLLEGIRTTGKLPEGDALSDECSVIHRCLRHREGRLIDGRWPGAHPPSTHRIKSTQKITKAMELIAASQIVRAQGRIAASRPYQRGMAPVDNLRR